MKIFQISKDGGPESRVWGYFLVEAKKAFSVVLLNFKDGSREAFHTHAFNAVSWVLWGRLTEYDVDGSIRAIYTPSLLPIYTPRERFHMVSSKKNSWVLSFRGPWTDYWKEKVGNKKIILTHGRKVVDAID